MLNLNKSIFILLLFFINKKIISQNGEVGGFDCNYLKQVVIPFNYSIKNNAHLLLNQTVFYGFRDQVIFWYKLEVREDENINIKIKALNDSDSYSTVFYHYNQTNFCESVNQKKIQPLNKINVQNFEVKKDNIYYLGVINTSLNNCGHRLILSYKTDSLKVDALHLPCRKEVLGAIQKVESVNEKKLNSLKTGEGLILKNIYFVPNTYALNKESLPELEKLYHYLNDNQNIYIEIQGHSNGDNRVTTNEAYIKLGEEWNFNGSAKDLSKKRAQVIKKYLVSNGIKKKRVKAKGFGGQKPIIISPESFEEAQKNIRVEIVVLKANS